MKKIAIKTKIGWVTAFEENNKIFQIKFIRSKNQSNTKVLKNFKGKLFYGDSGIYLNSYIISYFVIKNYNNINVLSRLSNLHCKLEGRRHHQNID